MKIAILGAGTWGTAIARHLALKNYDVILWSAIESEIDLLSNSRRHPNLKGAELPPSVCFTKSLSCACDGAEMLVFAVPSIYIRSTARAAAPYMTAGQIVVNLSKGIDPDRFFPMTRVIEEEVNIQSKSFPVVALSGPTHAEEVALDLPTTIVSASQDPIAANKVRDVFSSPLMRVYTSGDVQGVELCGALKNIIALAAGMLTGIGYGDNAKAALITRGMVEIARLGRAMGCSERTFYGLAGIGDLIVTATSVHSRNNRAGQLMGQGMTAEQATKEVGMVVEGLYALPAAVGLASMYGVEMPIVTGVNEIVNHGAEPREIVNRLMTRESKNEALS